MIVGKKKKWKNCSKRKWQKGREREEELEREYEREYERLKREWESYII